jgi:5-methylcytosine-specific restriction endonuclease McrA
MNAALRAAVRSRANDRCEYCQRLQLDSPLVSLQIEHVVPRKHGGDDDFGNLALACAECNLHKGSDLTGIDPASNAITPLFNPRAQKWPEHFSWDGQRIVGLTAVGRVTIRVLQLNAIPRIRIRLRTRGRS